MKKTVAMLAVVLTLGLAAVDAEAAKRLGGGKSTGMQRQNVTETAKPGGTPAAQPGQTPATAAAAAPGAAAAAAAAPAKRSWMGPLAGLAAGLGLAALASHLGFGEAFGNILMIGLLVMLALAAVAFFMRKRAMGQQPAAAGAGAGGFGGMPPAQPTGMERTGLGQQGGSVIGSRIGSGLAGSQAVPKGPTNIPADFDAAGFVRNAKAQFMALQAANDARDLDRLRDYLTPQMFDLVRAELAERGDAPQKTEVFGLDAQVLDVTEEAAQYVVSVRFTGSTRAEQGADTDALDEVWHLTKPRTGFGGWVVAGIEQV